MQSWETKARRRCQAHAGETVGDQTHAGGRAGGWAVRTVVGGVYKAAGRIAGAKRATHTQKHEEVPQALVPRQFLARKPTSPPPGTLSSLS